MNQKRLSPLYTVLGVLCLVGAAACAMALLPLGGVADHIFVAAVLLAFGALALGLLKREGVSREELLFMLLPIGAALLIRVLLLNYASGDYNSFLSHWYTYFRENGGFQAMAHSVGDYNVPYLYFMAAISYLNVPDLYLIKLFSVLFDVLLAWGGFRLARVLRGGRRGDGVPLTAFALLLFLPTVVLNGAYWGQCDAIYGALVLHALAQVLAGKNKSSLVLLQIADHLPHPPVGRAVAGPEGEVLGAAPVSRHLRHHHCARPAAG